MSSSSPFNEEWNRLGAASAEFLRARCWEWMTDTDIFGVQNPADGETGYCCVMGNGGELFGLAVYLGTTGLLAHHMIVTGVLEPGDIDVLRYQRCLLIEFEDRGALDSKDLDIVKRTGVTFRGRKSWPRFASYRPGCVPWKLTSEEARFFTIALEQSLLVALRFRECNTLLDSSNPGENFFVRVPETGSGGRVWTDQWLVPAPVMVEDYSLSALEEKRLERIARRVSSGGENSGCLEIDTFLGPIIKGDKSNPCEGPYFGDVYLCVDQDSFFVLDSFVRPPFEPWSSLRSRFIHMLEEDWSVPGKVLVRRRELFDLLQPVAERLGFEIKLSGRLRSLDHAANALHRFLETGRM